MKKRVICLLLVLAMALPMAVTGAFAAGGEAGQKKVFETKEIKSEYFYKQLNTRAQAIYNKLYEAFTKGNEGGPDYTGTTIIDITDVAGVKEDIPNYLKGNKEIFNDFCAAKDALDLDHSELWWIDSGYLSFYVTQKDQDDNQYHVLIGPGRGKTYLLGGKTIDQVKEKDEALKKILDGIVEKAKTELAAVNAGQNYSIADQIASLVRSVHTSVTEGLSYRYETECNSGDEPYIRTLYALATKQGVCEAYSRAMQVCLTRLGVECVLIHGIQTKGTPENHMWNAVNIPDDGAAGDEDGRWYVVDATWDDPVPVDWYGRRDLKNNQQLGKDDTETVTYLMVGQNVVGQYWQPSGYVSTGLFEFKYPTIETSSYNGSTAFGDDSGLKVDYSAGSGNLEDGTPAGVFTVTFRGKNMAKSAEEGFYFLLRMHDMHPDGTSHVMHEWYYANAALLFLARNKYFFDGEDGLHVYTATCEYVEVAVTTRKPEGYDQWASRTDWGTTWQQAYYNGDESDFVAESGMLYNTNASYEAPPYVFRQTPAANGQTTAGYDYRVDVIYDDSLTHPASTGLASIDNFTDNSVLASNQTVRVRYTTYQQDLHTGGDMVATIAGELPFDRDRDGYVDMPDDENSNDYVDFSWHYVYADNPSACPNANGETQHVCDVDQGCPINGVTFMFRASNMWQDDVTQYQFQIEGVVGSRSKKFPNPFDIYAMVPGLCPACYRSQGIDWNLWGKPTLLDAPENLDLAGMAEKGGTDKETLDKLREEMNENDLNGRLMLVVEDKTPGAGNREEYQKIENALQESDEGKKIEGQQVVGRSVFEINFNRICPMVKLKPGESLRVQVGYPAGITYEDLTKDGSDVELKAYHFTRCDSSVNKDCEELQKEIEAGKASKMTEEEVRANHAWGDHILSVEEITLIPTPYGMVIMCDSFSPFEIVAVKKDPNAPAAIAETNTYTVVVVEGANGSVTIGGHEALGDNGNVELKDGETRTFTVKADEGYEVESVSLGGVELEADENGSYTLKAGENVKHNDVLSVTFVPKSVTEEIAEYGTAVAAAVCLHPKDKQKVEEAEQKATCTKAGHTAKIVCQECQMVIQDSVEIPATGHNLKLVGENTAPTCETKGHRAGAECQNDNCEFSYEGNDIPAAGHQFSDYNIVEGKTTCAGAVKTAKCDNCDAVDEMLDPKYAAEHNFIEEVNVVTEPDCITDKVVEMKCQWCQETKNVTITGSRTNVHKPDANGICQVCKENVCKDGHNYVVVKGKAATCTDSGLSDYEQCSVCGHVKEAQKVLPALGHDFGGKHTAGTRCSVCGFELQQDSHTVEAIPELHATCTTEGSHGGTHCAVCGDIIEQPTIVEALGHDWNFDAPEWIWSTDNTSASVTVTCRHDGNHKETFNAEVKVEETQAPTCSNPGTATLTATVTYDGRTYTVTKESVEIPTLDHTVVDWTPAADATCKVHGHDEGTCTVCGQKVTREREELLPHNVLFDNAQETPATCTEPGQRTGKCMMCEEVVTVEDADAPALGHSYGRYNTVTEATCTEPGLMRARCVRGDSTVSRTIPALGHDYVDGVCSRCGQEDPDAVWESPFVDVPSLETEAWFADDVKYVVKRGIMNGIATDNFGASLVTTREQVTAILARLAGVEEALDPVHWAEAGMAWAVEHHISDGKDPGGVITREMFVTMLWRYMDEPESTFDLSGFADADSISGYARTAIAWAVEHDILRGLVIDGAACLLPQETAIRTQTAAFLTRFCEAFDL